MDFDVREVHKVEEAARLEIVKAATQELRRTYRPRATAGCAVVAPVECWLRCGAIWP